MLTLGSLFDGIGGFPFCAELSGVIPVWASEVDPACIAITRQRFPNMMHLGDISKISGASIPPVDIITFGSPCQDLSVAGQRKGIKHAEKGDSETTRSGLFLEAIRIIYEMRAVTYGRYPTYIIWENVAGAFSSQRGRDFQTVLQEITKTDIPIPPSGRWAAAGVVRGRGICVAWRQLDAQYWGVPQRRKRIYLIGSFGNDSAAEILFKCDGVQGYLTQSGTQGEGIAAAAENGTGGCGSKSRVMQRNKLVVRCSAGFNGQNSITAAGVELHNEKSPTLTAKKQVDVIYAAGFLDRNSSKARSIGYEENKSPTLRSSVIPTAVYAIDRAAFNQGENAQYDFEITDSGINSTVVAKGPSAVAYEYIYRWIVRRLTPLECERLQGYPDYWTVLPKVSDMSDEDYAFWKDAFILDKQICGKSFRKEPTKKEILKRYNSLDSDSSRYRMLGNSLAIPCALRVIKGIADYVRGDVRR